MFMWLTSENEGDSKDNKEAAVETDTKGRPGQSRLNQREEYRKNIQNDLLI